MVIRHAFYKKASKVVQDTTKKYFEHVGNPSEMELNRFEQPIQTIRRVLGNNFYDLTKSKEDLINMDISDEASFDINSIKSDLAINNFKVMNEISNFVVFTFDKFARMYGNTIIGPEFEDVKFKVAITSSTKGLICKELSIKDFAPLSTFDGSGNVIGVVGQEEITALSSEVFDADSAAKKLQGSGNGSASNAAMAALATKINELNQKLIAKYMNIVETFFNLITTWGEVDKCSDIYNVTFIFNMIIVDNDTTNENEEHSIVEMDVSSLHDIAHKHFKSLKDKFD